MFKTIPRDPIAVKIHSLKNGLKLFLTINKDQPRVYTEIAVRAGSKHDPAETTGLAHYFEHMMFKGTDRLGSLDWAKEKPLLDKIESLFEQHRTETDPEKKRDIYAEIDKTSFEAAKYVASNEYDRMVSAIGAKGTNAYTWVEQTVYVNDIPSNELERWFALESERFRRPVLRLFHTELETVFEEYNINQDKDFRKTLKATQEMLTPSHPYGTQTTLGRGEDLKNPSQTNIYRFFDQYYVPNNMAISISGDFEPEEVVALADKYFGQFEAKQIPKFTYKKQAEITGRQAREVWGQEAAWVDLNWRFEGAKTDDALIMSLITGILYNQQAGLIDLNLIQKQQVLEAYAYPHVHEDYCSLAMHGKPREGQTLEDVEQMLLKEIANLREGNFEEWLPQAVVRDMKLSEIKGYEKNNGRVSALTNAFVLGIEWKEMVGRWSKLQKITKEEVVNFAQKHLRDDNYVVVFKRHGEDNNVMKVEKPPITAIEMNRDENSKFAQEFLSKEAPEIAPQFLDFHKLIKKTTLRPGVTLHQITGKESQIFRLYFIFEMGKTADLRLSFASGYLSYLGTSKYSAPEMQQQFYKLGVQLTAECQENRLYFTLTGLPESFEEAVALVEHLFNDAQPNQSAYENMVADILARRANAKLDKGTILRKAMSNFGKYGAENPYTYRLNTEQLKALKPEEIIGLIRGLKSHQHTIFYHGPAASKRVKEILQLHHNTPSDLHKPLKNKTFREKSINKDRVLFVHFPMVQMELLLMSRGTPKFDLSEYVLSEWYNNYFGYGMSSIIFQEIREAKALAYSAYAYAGSPQRKDKSHFLTAYVGTQPDKIHEAVSTFQSLLEDMPVSIPQMEHAKQSVLKQIAADRITRSQIYWNYRSTQDRGLKQDVRQATFEHLQQASPEHLVAFQQQKMKGRQFTWLVLGDRARIDFKYLGKIGHVKELKLEEIFGY